MAIAVTLVAYPTAPDTDPRHILFHGKHDPSKMGAGAVDMTLYRAHWPCRAPCPPMVVTADLATHLEAVKDAVWRAAIRRRSNTTPRKVGSEMGCDRYPRSD